MCVYKEIKIVDIDMFDDFRDQQTTEKKDQS